MACTRRTLAFGFSATDVIYAVVSLLYFFFSSRRRHTRFDCDWSSDVCSSDLRCAAYPRGECATTFFRRPRTCTFRRHKKYFRECTIRPCPRTPHSDRKAPRSEEHTSELQSQSNLVCRLLLEKKNHTSH